MKWEKNGKFRNDSNSTKQKYPRAATTLAEAASPRLALDETEEGQQSLKYSSSSNRQGQGPAGVSLHRMERQMMRQTHEYKNTDDEILELP